MDNAKQLRDGGPADSSNWAKVAPNPDPSLMMGQLIASQNATNKRLDETNSSVARLIELMHDGQIEHARYYAGLERANGDIQEIRDTQRHIAQRVDDSVSVEQFKKLEQHVKTLNGTDGKLRMLGVDISNSEQVAAVHQFITSGITAHKRNAVIKQRVITTIITAVALSLCLAAWSGISDTYLNPKQEQTK